MTTSSYVALGDSFTEGVGDPDPSRPHGVRGWADRVAEVLGARTPGFRYANLAVRGRKLRAVVEEQVAPALALRPDLVTIYAGGNDLLRPVVDVDAIVAEYAVAIAALTAEVPQVLVFTGFDLGQAPVFGRLRGRVATYNELVREVADDTGATIVDFWRMRDYHDPRLWAEDRIHMAQAGHARMAVRVLDVLGVEHGLVPDALPEAPPPDRRARREADLAWARAHATPWLHRRFTGRSSGDGLTPRYPVLTPVGPSGIGSPLPSDADPSGSLRM